jgi:predicted Zn-dependent protease
MGKNAVTTGVLRLGAAALGLGQLGDLGAQIGAQLLQLKYSRDDETEADQLGLLMAAKAGYDPRKGVSLWEKMGAAGGGAPPAMLSTHPSGPQRIQDIQGRLPVVLPQWEGAPKPQRRFGPPDKLPPAKPRG